MEHLVILALRTLAAGLASDVTEGSAVAGAEAGKMRLKIIIYAVLRY